MRCNCLQTENYIIDRVERIRQAKSLSRYRMAQRAGLSQSSISNLLNRRNVPSIQTLEKICNGLGMTLAQFFSADGERPDLTKEQEHVLDVWDQLNELERARVKAFVQGMRDL